MSSSKTHTDPLAAFTQAVRRWFKAQFHEPTPIQEQAWNSIQNGSNTLVIAPTGSGKTFAAFLSTIDSLASEKASLAHGAAPPPKGVRVLYVSPLKALGADIERNLQAPLASIAHHQSTASNNDVAQITVGIRTGDTPQSERARLMRNPPDVLITTPESLYLMLTSKARDTLATVQTVIVDELHSLAGTKRGAHLSLSLERLDALLPEPAQRIGLSATIKPVDTAAAFLGGIHPVNVVQDSTPPSFTWDIVVPVEDLTNIQPLPSGITGAPHANSGTASIWPYIESSVLHQVLTHKSTIIFTNSRGLCERLTARLNAAYDAVRGNAVPAAADSLNEGAFRSELGSSTLLVSESDDPLAQAHHGSISKERRHQIESDLKSGRLKCVVATSSLELGIDMGQVDLVIQIAAPPSISSGLQRIGRANHQVNGVSVGLMYPRTRFEVLDAAFAVEGMLAGAIESTHLVKDALDVLAQQTAAEAAMHPEGISPGAWLALVKRSACYQHLPQGAFQAVLEMLAGSFTPRSGPDLAPCLDLDRAADLLRPLPRTQKLAVSAAGTIPDRGLYPVMLSTGTQTTGRKRVGELDEEMVHESRVGDVIILGTSTWRITKITNDRVLVAPAPGRTARLPFWHGEGIGRALDAGIQRGKLQSRLDEHTSGQGVIDDALNSELAAVGLGAHAQENLGALVASQRMSTRALPTDSRIILETCPDDTGARYLVVHSPFGKRVNEPWALAISARVRSLYGFDPECAALNNGIVARIPTEDENVLTPEVLTFSPDELQSVVTASIEETSLFAARFRECSARSLLMRSSSPGKRTPLWQQRLRGGQLLEAIRDAPDHPVYLEAVRECLDDVLDLAGACWLMGQIEAGVVALEPVQTQHPSPFASPLLFGYVADHLYNGDMPHAERNRTLLSVDSELLAELLGTPDQLALLQPTAVACVHLEVQHLATSHQRAGSEGIAELLRQLGPLTTTQIKARVKDDDAVEDALKALETQHRACPAAGPDGTLWATPEDALCLQALSGTTIPDWILAWTDTTSNEDDVTTAARTLVKKLVRTHGLISAQQCATQLGCPCQVIEEALATLKASEDALSLPVSREAHLVLTHANALIEHRVGSTVLLPDEGAVWTTKDMLRRLRLRSRDDIEAETQPVDSATFSQLVLTLQRLNSNDQSSSLDDLAECIALFEGFRFSAQTWEEVILPARVPEFHPSLLDELLGTAEVIWAASQTDAKMPTVALYPTDSPFAPRALDPSLEEPDQSITVPHDDLNPVSHPLEAELCALLGTEGPLTLPALVRLLQETSQDEAVSPQAVAQAMRRLAVNGSITSSSFACLRAQPSGTSAAPTQSRRRVSSRRSSRSRVSSRARQDLRSIMVAGQHELEALAGHWRVITPPDISATECAIMHVESILDAYGIVCPKTIEASGFKGGMQAVYDVLRGMEDAGEVLRGEFVQGLGSSQFARRGTIETLRRTTTTPTTVLSGTDPAMLYGSVLPWPEPFAAEVPSNRAHCLVVLKEGSPVLFATKHLHHLITSTVPSHILEETLAALTEHVKHPPSALKAARVKERLVVQKVNGQDIYGTEMQDILSHLGFIRDAQGMRLYLQPF